MTGKRIVLRVFILVLIIGGAVLCLYGLGRNGQPYYNSDGTYRHITGDESFRYLEKHPAYAGFSSFIQPWKDTVNRTFTPFLSIRAVCAMNHANVDSIVDGFNCILDASAKGQIYYDFYTEQERAQDPTKEETGLIFIPGEENAPVAFLTSGGAFKSVCLFLEGFPVGSKLHEEGYNVFILKYRVDPEADSFGADQFQRESEANEDFARALQYVFQNQTAFGVSMEDYSVWGFSAGGRTTFLWGLDNEYGYRHYGLPAPAAMVLVYSGWYDDRFDGHYGTVPPTFLAWLPEDDVIGPEFIEGIKRYIELLKGQGTPLEEHAYYNAYHGFGEGRGSGAEGWIDKAAAFWEAQRDNS